MKILVNKRTGGIVLSSGKKSKDGSGIKVRRQGNATRVIKSEVLKSNWKVIGKF